MAEFVVTDELGEFLNFEVVVDSNQAEFMDAEVGVNEVSHDRQCTWTRPMILSLIQEYKSRIATVGRSVKTLKQLFKILASIINTTFNTNFNGEHIANKWKTLERAYKKKKDNDSRTGRGAKHFEYEEFLDEIYLKSPKIHPELTLSETEKVLPPPPTPQIIPTSKSCPRVGASTPEIDQLTQGPSPPQKCRQTKNTRNDVLELMRKDRLKYYEKKLKQQDVKIAQRDNRIEVLKEMKELLKVYLEKKNTV